MIYFIQPIEGGPIKIGTSIRLTQRLKELAAAHQCELRVLAVMAGGYAEEAELHRKFSHLKVVNEWFEAGDDLLGFIVESANQWDGVDEVPPVLALSPAKIGSEAIVLAKKAAALKEMTLYDFLTMAVLEVAEREIQKEAARLANPRPPKR